MSEQCQCGPRVSAQLHSHLNTGKCESSEGPVDPSSVEFPTTHPYWHMLLLPHGQRYRVQCAVQARGQGVCGSVWALVCGEG